MRGVSSALDPCDVITCSTLYDEQADADVAVPKINVNTATGKVALKGEVKSMALWRKAESPVRGVEGGQADNTQPVITG